MAFWENLSGKKKSILLIIVGVIGIAMIVFGIRGLMKKSVRTSGN